MADENSPTPKNKLTPEEFDKLSTELWKTFDKYSGQQGNSHDYCRTAATTALAIIQLQALKPL